MKKQNEKIMEKQDCSPLSSIYCNIKLTVTGRLNNNDLNNLYDCNLCNQCYLANVNRHAREKSVKKGIVSNHVVEIRDNIIECGNSYGIKTVKANRGKSNIQTLLFRGCTPTHKTPEILKAAEKLLRKNGIKYDVMEDETCCGNILFNLGDISAGQGAVQRNIDKFKARGVQRIITLCPGCYNAFNKYYTKNKEFNPEIILLVDLLEDINLDGNFTVQDPCHAREKGVKVRRILPGVINKTSSSCCGAGGGVKIHNRVLATNKARKSFENNTAIITYCPFCYLNLSSVAPSRVKDLYQLLDENTNPCPEITPY